MVHAILERYPDDSSYANTKLGGFWISVILINLSQIRQTRAIQESVKSTYKVETQANYA